MPKSSGSSSTTTSNEPWESQQPYLLRGFNQAWNAYQNTPKNAYQGQYIADPTQGQRDARNQGYATGTDWRTSGNALANFGLQEVYNQFGLPMPGQVGANGTPLRGGDMNFLDVKNNPYFMPALQGNVDQITRNAYEQMLPAISSQAQQQGAYGGSRHGFALGRGSEAATRAIADATANATLGAYNQAYTTERGIQNAQEQQLAAQNFERMQAQLAMAPQLAGMGTQMQGQGVNLQNQMAALQQQWNQQAIDDRLMQREGRINAPWNGLEQYMNLIGSSIIPGMQVSQGPEPSGFGNFLGGALGGGTLGYGLAGAAGLTNPWLLAGGGALLGGLGGYFG